MAFHDFAVPTRVSLRTKVKRPPGEILDLDAQGFPVMRSEDMPRPGIDIDAAAAVAPRPNYARRPLRPGMPVDPVGVGPQMEKQYPQLKARRLAETAAADAAHLTNRRDAGASGIEWDARYRIPAGRLTPEQAAKFSENAEADISPIVAGPPGPDGLPPRGGPMQTVNLRQRSAEQDAWKQEREKAVNAGAARLKGKATAAGATLTGLRGVSAGELHRQNLADMGDYLAMSPGGPNKTPTGQYSQAPLRAAGLRRRAEDLAMGGRAAQADRENNLAIAKAEDEAAANAQKLKNSGLVAAAKARGGASDYDAEPVLQALYGESADIKEGKGKSGRTQATVMRDIAIQQGILDQVSDISDADLDQLLSDVDADTPAAKAAKAAMTPADKAVVDAARWKKGRRPRAAAAV